MDETVRAVIRSGIADRELSIANLKSQRLRLQAELATVNATLAYQEAERANLLAALPLDPTPEPMPEPEPMPDFEWPEYQTPEEGPEVNPEIPVEAPEDTPELPEDTPEPTTPEIPEENSNEEA